jgi:hypothetical protein
MFFNKLFDNQPVCLFRSGQPGDLPQVVGQDPQSNPGLRSFKTPGQTAAYPVLALNVADQRLASGPPALQILEPEL